MHLCTSMGSESMGCTCVHGWGVNPLIAQVAAFTGQTTGIARALLYFAGGLTTNYRVDVPSGALVGCKRDNQVGGVPSGGGGGGREI